MQLKPGDPNAEHWLLSCNILYDVFIVASVADMHRIVPHSVLKFQIIGTLKPEVL